MASDTIYYELPGDSPPSMKSTMYFATKEEQQHVNHGALNFSRPRPRPQLASRNDHDNAPQPTPLHIPDYKRISKGDSCIEFSPDDETMRISDDDSSFVENDDEHDFDIDFGDALDRGHGLDDSNTTPDFRFNENLLPSSPAIPQNVMRWREPIDAVSDQDMSDASSIPASDIDTHHPLSDDGSFVFDGRLGWTPRKSSQAEHDRQRYAYPTPRHQNDSTGSLGHISPVKSPEPAETQCEPKRRVLTKKRPFAIKTHHIEAAETNPQLLPTPPLIMKNITFEQHSEAIDSAVSSNFPTPTIDSCPPSSDRSSLMSELTEVESRGTSIGSMHSGPPYSILSSGSGDWRSSELDTTGMTEAQIRKMRRRGLVR